MEKKIKDQLKSLSCRKLLIPVFLICMCVLFGGSLFARSNSTVVLAENNTNTGTKDTEISTAVSLFKSDVLTEKTGINKEETDVAAEEAGNLISASETDQDADSLFIKLLKAIVAKIHIQEDTVQTASEEQVSSVLSGFDSIFKGGTLPQNQEFDSGNLSEESFVTEKTVIADDGFILAGIYKKDLLGKDTLLMASETDNVQSDKTEEEAQTVTPVDDGISENESQQNQLLMEDLVYASENEGTAEDAFDFNSAVVAEVIHKDELVNAVASGQGDITGITDRVTLSGFADDTATAVHTQTHLTYLENVDGQEEYKLDGQSLYWEYQGKDIVFEGNGQKELPVAFKIQYYLNGHETTASDIKGQSGHVKIVVSYTNQTSESTYIPYTVLTMVILDTEKFSNVTTNGTAVASGYSQIIYGTSVPGLQQELSASASGIVNLGLSESLVIEADVNDYSVDTFEAVITTGSFSDIDLDGLDSLSSLSGIADQINAYGSTLAESLTSLDSGMAVLAQGLDTLANGSDTQDFTDGISALSEGTASLSSGLESLSEGAASLSDGSTQFSEALSEYVDGMVTLRDGITELRESVSFLPEIAASLDEITENLDSLIEFLRNLIDESECLDQAIENSVTVGDQDTAEQLQALQSSINDTVSSGGIISSLLDLMQAVSDSLKTASDQITLYYDGMSEAQAGAETLTTAAQQLKEAQAVLDNGIQQASSSVDVLNEGGKALNEGSSVLNEGFEKMRLGMVQLFNGALTLSTGCSSLQTGVAAMLNQMGSGSVLPLTSVTETLKRIQAEDAAYHPYDLPGSSTGGSVTYMIQIGE